MKTETDEKFRIEWMWNGQWKMDDEGDQNTRGLSKEKAERNERELRRRGHIPQMTRIVSEVR